MHMKCIDPLVLKAVSRSNDVFKNSVSPTCVISPAPIRNSRCLIQPSPDTFPRMGTLYGGSVKTI